MSRTVKWLHVKMLIVLSNGSTTDGKLIIVYCYKFLLVIFILPFILLLNLFTCLLGNLYSVGLKEEVIYSVALRNNLINCYHYMYYYLVETRRCVVLLFLPT